MVVATEEWRKLWVSSVLNYHQGDSEGQTIPPQLASLGGAVGAVAVSEDW
jgi:hypothetical protein